MDQITLIFLIGSFTLLMLQIKYPKEFTLKLLGLFSSASLIALSLLDSQLLLNQSILTIMLGTGFVFTAFTIVGMLKAV